MVQKMNNKQKGENMLNLNETIVKIFSELLNIITNATRISPIRLIVLFVFNYGSFKHFIFYFLVKLNYNTHYSYLYPQLNDYITDIYLFLKKIDITIDCAYIHNLLCIYYNLYNKFIMSELSTKHNNIIGDIITYRTDLNNITYKAIPLSLVKNDPILMEYFEKNDLFHTGWKYQRNYADKSKLSNILHDLEVDGGTIDDFLQGNYERFPFDINFDIDDNVFVFMEDEMDEFTFAYGCDNLQYLCVMYKNNDILDIAKVDLIKNNVDINAIHIQFKINPLSILNNSSNGILYNIIPARNLPVSTRDAKMKIFGFVATIFGAQLIYGDFYHHRNRLGGDDSHYTYDDNKTITADFLKMGHYCICNTMCFL